MEQPRNKLSPRDQILVKAVRRLQYYDENFGDPKVVAACAGELQQIFLKYAVNSSREFTAAEHSAVDEALRHIARIACGPTIFEDSYVEAGAFLAIAGEAALYYPLESKPVVPDTKGQETEVEAQMEAAAAAIEGRAPSTEE